jgi:aminoglycoside 2'-N-acetyltransferase I
VTIVQRFTTTEASEELLAEIRDLLFAAFPGTFSEHDWHHCLGGDHLVIRDDGTLVTHAAVVPRSICVGEDTIPTGYVEGVATLPARQGQGLGSAMMRAVTDLLHEQFDMGALSTGRRGFYEELGWESWHGPSFVIHDTELVRTEDEDDGIMVLRFGRSAEVDLSSPIACESRPGDDW